MQRQNRFAQPAITQSSAPYTSSYSKNKRIIMLKYKQQLVLST
jgi:hypothetical protein